MELFFRGPKMDEMTKHERKLRNTVIYILQKILLDEQIKENEMGETCSTYGVIEMHAQF
jgi:hypothetical protein